VDRLFRRGRGLVRPVVYDCPVVYGWCMARTNVDIDDEACDVIMRRYRLSSKREAINYALRLVAGEALDVEEARALRGSGWDGDLDEMRSSRSA
jgi:Arc/MetJ family transcription regulator